MGPEKLLGTPRNRLDQFLPVYEFNEIHRINVKASRTRAFETIKSVTADEILFFRTMVWMRRFGRSRPESVLNPPRRAPLLEVATRTSFIWLADDQDREVVVGTVVIAPAQFHRAGLRPEDFVTLHQPGFAFAAMNFVLEDSSPGKVRVTTETRVHATDPATRGRFAMYWRVIYPGSAFIRRMWLRAIKRRAER